MVDRWLKDVQSWLLPARCLLCAAPSGGPLELCQACRADLPVNRHACRRCAQPLAVGLAEPLCGCCLRRPPPFEQAFAPFLYQAPLSQLIQRFKFGGQLPVARLLGALLTEALRGRSEPLPQLLVPVPLHPGRLRERGFNQALELARPLGRHLGVAVDARCCARVRPTLAQSSLPAGQRRGNLRGAFAVRRPLDGVHLAIVDDVLTTGQTVRELARTLRRGGAGRVEVWVCARAP